MSLVASAVFHGRWGPLVLAAASSALIAPAWLYGSANGILVVVALDESLYQSLLWSVSFVTGFTLDKGPHYNIRPHLKHAAALLDEIEALDRIRHQRPRQNPAPKAPRTAALA
jgi:hypothetical protein